MITRLIMHKDDVEGSGGRAPRVVLRIGGNGELHSPAALNPAPNGNEESPPERREEEKTFAPLWDSKADFPVTHPLTPSLY